jgi:ribosome-binding protein aMBF1 (putative translation factor)
MSEEKKVWWVKGEHTAKDMGGIIKAIREDHLAMTQEQLAEAIDMKLNTFKSCENGKGNHVSNALRRICEKYELKTVLQVKA